MALSGTESHEVDEEDRAMSTLVCADTGGRRGSGRYLGGDFTPTEPEATRAAQVNGATGVVGAVVSRVNDALSADDDSDSAVGGGGRRSDRNGRVEASVVCSSTFH